MDIYNFIVNNQYFGAVLCLFAFAVGDGVSKRFKSPLLNPFVIAQVATVCLLLILKVDFQAFKKSASVLTYFVTPCCVAMAVPLYKQWDKIVANKGVIISSVFGGALTSAISVFAICKLLGVNAQVFYSFLPKSVTTPIAVGISTGNGGISAITVVSVIFTGLMGGILFPPICKALKIESKIAVGLSIGSSSHVFGTSMAYRIGEEEGAMSSLSIVISGLITVFIAPIFVMFY